MPSKVVTANTDGIEVFNATNIGIGKIKGIIIDNQAGSAVTVTIKDIFTPSPTVANPTPSEVTEDKFVITVAAGDFEDINLSNRSVDIIGVCKVFGSITDAACKITVIYDIEEI